MYSPNFNTDIALWSCSWFDLLVCNARTDIYVKNVEFKIWEFAFLNSLSLVAKVLKTAEFKNYVRNMFERQVMAGDLQYNRQSSLSTFKIASARKWTN